MSKEKAFIVDAGVTNLPFARATPGGAWLSKHKEYS